MDKKILVLMVVLAVAAVLIVAGIMVASGGFARSGGFTRLFDKLVNDEADVTYGQHLRLPESWTEGDTKTVSDSIVAMRSVEADHGYTTILWFVYKGDKWNDVDHGTLFYVPADTFSGSGLYLKVENGLFFIEVWSASNLVSNYDPGDTITVETQIVLNDNNDLAFHHEWRLASET